MNLSTIHAERIAQAEAAKSLLAGLKLNRTAPVRKPVSKPTTVTFAAFEIDDDPHTAATSYLGQF